MAPAQLAIRTGSLTVIASMDDIENKVNSTW